MLSKAMIFHNHENFKINPEEIWVMFFYFVIFSYILGSISFKEYINLIILWSDEHCKIA